MKNTGFTLAELLIALAILGIIATFTIPKVLQSQADSKLKSIGKETAGMISGAYEAYKQQNSVVPLTGPEHLTPYMNYVAIDSTSTIDRSYNDTTMSCGSFSCLRLHNGGTLLFTPGDEFGATAATNAIYFYLDPDGVSNASTTGPGKSVVFWLYATGRIVTWGTLEPGTRNDTAATYNPDPSRDPPWFGWN